MNSIKKRYISLRNYLSYAGFSPSHDWTILLVICATLLIIVFIISGLLFLRFSLYIEPTSEEFVIETDTIDREKLSEVLNHFKARQSDIEPRESLLVDPSR